MNMPITSSVWNGLNTQFHTYAFQVSADNSLVIQKVKILGNAGKQTLIVLASVITAIATPIFALFDGIYHMALAVSLLANREPEIISWYGFYSGSSEVKFKGCSYWEILGALEDKGQNALDMAYLEVLFPMPKMVFRMMFTMCSIMTLLTSSI